MGLFSTEGFVPRSQCGAGWTPELIAAHRISDLLIFCAYVAIPLIVVWRARRGLPFIARSPVGLALLVGFVASCGLTHLSNQAMFVWPAYHLDALFKAVCATFSLVAAGYMVWDALRR